MTRIAEGLAGRSPIRDGLALAAVLIVALTYAHAFLAAPPQDIGRDLALYQREVQAWLGGAPVYPGFEVQGPFAIVADVILYPPITILLFVPTLLLPLPLWWLIPGAISAIALYQLRPGFWWLLAMALCLTYYTSPELVVAGNPDLWLVAALMVAPLWRPAAAFVLLKPSVFPFALVGIKSRGWWALVGVFAAVSLALLPQTLGWLAVVRNGYEPAGGYHGAGLTYSLYDLPLLLVPLLAWAGSTRAGPDAAALLAGLRLDRR